MSKNEGYIHDLCSNLDYSISIHRCSEFADGVIFMELFYKDQKHVMVMNAGQAKAIGLYLYDAAKKLKAERIEQLKMATLFSFIFSMASLSKNIRENYIVYYERMIESIQYLEMNIGV